MPGGTPAEDVADLVPVFESVLAVNKVLVVLGGTPVEAVDDPV